MRYTFDAASDASTQKKRQSCAKLGPCGTWEDGWLEPARRRRPARTLPCGSTIGLRTKSSRSSAPRAITHHESMGTTKLSVNDHLAAEGPMRPSPEGPAWVRLR